jgi:hypothetical protein
MGQKGKGCAPNAADALPAGQPVQSGAAQSAKLPSPAYDPAAPYVPAPQQLQASVPGRPRASSLHAVQTHCADSAVLLCSA